MVCHVKDRNTCRQPSKLCNSCGRRKASTAEHNYIAHRHQLECYHVFSMLYRQLARLVLMKTRQATVAFSCTKPCLKQLDAPQVALCFYSTQQYSKASRPNVSLLLNGYSVSNQATEYIAYEWTYNECSLGYGLRMNQSQFKFSPLRS